MLERGTTYIEGLSSFSATKLGSVKAFGVYRAKVIENKDPLNQNRVKVYIPELFITGVQDVDGIWARPIYLFSSQAITPRIGDTVLVMFENGDLQKKFQEKKISFQKKK